jgi:L-lactate dehydrogenase complex protein LldE
MRQLLQRGRICGNLNATCSSARLIQKWIPFETSKVMEVRGRTMTWSSSCPTSMKVDAFPWANFPHRVGLHNSCGTLRQLKHATPSELREPVFSKPMDLLSRHPGAAVNNQIVCFGGAFSGLRGSRLY